MNPPVGTNLRSLPLSGLHHVRDLIYFDGPLLSHFENENGDDYLYYWVDCDDECNRWMILRVGESSILRLINRLVPLDFVIPKGCRDSFVYLVDINADGGHSSVWLTNTSDLPAEYLPDAGVKLDAIPTQRDESSFSLVVEGDWTVSDLGEFPKAFSKTYSVLYGMNILHFSKVLSVPWRGGFSSMHFFKWAASQIPAEHRPSLSAIQYASPGFMRFSLHGAIGMQVAQCVWDYRSRNRVLAERYSVLSQYIRDAGLNDVEDPDDKRWDLHSTKLIELSGKLISGFTEINEKSFLEMCPRAFAAAKLSMAFYRNVKELLEFEKKGLVKFPLPEGASEESTLDLLMQLGE